jgi:hypothetical protein
VPPPAPKTVARPATLGACQVRLQLSMLLLPRTVRENFCAAKFTSLVALEQLNNPNVVGPCCSPAARRPATVRASASSQVAGRRVPASPRPPSRTSGWVSRTYFRGMGSLPSAPAAAGATERSSECSARRSVALPPVGSSAAIGGFVWLLFAPTLFFAFALIWVSLNLLTVQPVPGLFFGAVSVIGAILLARMVRAMASAPGSQDAWGLTSGPAEDFLVWGALALPLLITVALIVLLITGELRR